MIEVYPPFLEFIGAYRYKTGKITKRGGHLKSER